MIESAKKTALLLVNTHARKVQESLGFVVSKLQSLDLEIILRLTSSSEEFPRIIRSYQDQVDLLIIGGGDGTLNLLVDVLWETQLPLGILPMGTANDLAKTLFIPTDILAACEVIVAGEVHYIDLGCVNDKYFFNVASLGMSVKITKNLTSHEKKKWGVFAYAIAAMKMLWNYHPFHAEIHYDGQVKSVKTLQIAVGNGRYYGGGMTIAHDASIDDQRLDIYSIEIQHWWQFLWLLPALRKGRYKKELGIRSFEAKEITIFTRKAQAINTDGEITTYTPACFKIIPRAIPVIVPVAYKKMKPSDPNFDLTNSVSCD